MNDDELLAHLKATDPALTSKAPRPDVTRLVEATMNTTTDTPTSTTPLRTAPRRRLVPALAFAALLLVGGGITWSAAEGGKGTADNGGSPAPTATPLTLTLADSGSAGKCVALTPDLLRSHPLAFEGTVTAKQGDRVDLQVDHWYRADTADRPAEVRLVGDEGYAEATVFEVGAHYLVTAENGIVSMCGGTGEATDEARVIFREAFETSGKSGK